MSRLLAWLTPMRPFRLREVSQLDLLLANPTRLAAAIAEHRILTDGLFTQVLCEGTTGGAVVYDRRDPPPA